MSDPAAVRAEWASGDYPSVGERLAPAAEALVGRLGALEGAELLDVATGTGNTALAAARAGARVVGVDLTPELLRIARERAEREDLEADFVEGDAEALEFEEDRFDYVTSTFGVLFAPRPAVAAAELARVTTLGGIIALTTWPADGLAAAMRPGAAPSSPWTTPEGIEGLFAQRGVAVEVERRTDLEWRFADADEAATFVSTSVPHAGDRDALRDVFARHGRHDDRGLTLAFDYLLTLGTKTG